MQIKLKSLSQAIKEITQDPEFLKEVSTRELDENIEKKKEQVILNCVEKHKNNLNGLIHLKD